MTTANGIDDYDVGSLRTAARNYTDRRIAISAMKVDGDNRNWSPRVAGAAQQQTDACNASFAQLADEFGSAEKRLTSAIDAVMSADRLGGG